MQQPFRERCLKFSGEVLLLTSRLPKTYAGRHVSNQLLRSGTSIGANAYEARSAESRADFIHKMQVALKEARETGFWLELIQNTKITRDDALPALTKECDELCAILASSIITARKNELSR